MLVLPSSTDLLPLRWFPEGGVPRDVLAPLAVQACAVLCGTGRELSFECFATHRFPVIMQGVGEAALVWARPWNLGPKL